MKTIKNILFSACLVLVVLLIESMTVKAQISFEDAQQIGSGGGRIDAIQLEDMNNDGLPDLVFMNAGQSQFVPESEMFFIYHQLADGTYSESPDISFLYQGSHSDNGFEVYDMNLDGLKDIVHIGQKSVLIAFQEPLGVFTYEELPTLTSADAIEVGDFNNDGMPDITSMHFSKLNIFLQSQDNVFEPNEYLLDLAFAQQLMSADINNDGLDDLVCGGQIFKDTLHLLLQTPSGEFSAPISVPTANRVFTVGNFNNDAFVDLATYDGGEDMIQIWHWNNDSVTFIKHNILPVFQQVSSLEVADFNCDGYLDLVAPTSGWQNISVYPGSQLGFTVYISNHSSNSQTEINSLALGDINNDNFVDIVIGRNAFWGGEFLFGNSEPLLTDYEIIDTTVLVFEIEGDTSQLINFISTTEIDSTGECYLIITDSFRIETTLIQGIETVTQNTFALEAIMCDVLFLDTIISNTSEFSDFETSDTFYVATVIDTLVTEEIIFEDSILDTLDLIYFSDSILSINTDTFTNLDTSFYIIDSFFVISEYELSGITSCDITVTETKSCNVSTLDTSKLQQTFLDTMLVDVDTAFISRNITYIIITDVQKWSMEQNLTTYPNPTNDLLYVEIPLAVKTETITFYAFNLQGQRIPIAQERRTGEEQEIILNVNFLPDGRYILMMQSKDITWKTRFVKISN